MLIRSSLSSDNFEFTLSALDPNDLSKSVIESSKCIAFSLGLRCSLFDSFSTAFA